MSWALKPACWRMRDALAGMRRCGASPRCCTTWISSAIPTWTIPSTATRAALRYFREHDFPPELIQAVAGHAPYLGIPRTTKLDSALWATDELTGLIMAVAYVRPSKDLRDVEISSVKKKWKDRLFAAAISRQDIEAGAAELGIDTWEHVGIVLDAMKGIAAELGLDGRLAVS